MRVVVSCAGRFHAFNLVEQLFAHGHLERFITTTLNDRLLPNRALPESLKNNPDFRRKIVEIPFPEYACFAIRKLPAADAQSMAYFVKDNLFDQRARQEIPRSDLFVGWASQSLFQLREAKTRGAKGIIERGSTHISEQYRLIDAERQKFGVAASRRSRFDVMLEEKQLKEYHEADYIMVPSEFARRSFLDRGFPQQKVLKVRYGVDLTRFKPSVSREWSEEPTILFVGAIGFQKGVPYLLQAVQALKSAGTKVRLKLIGRMEDDFSAWLKSSPLRSTIDEHLSFVPHAELASHFGAADIFCLSSVQEGLALVIAEAMACGLPVVATTSTGGEEFITDGVSGILVPPADAAALQRAFSKLLESPDAALAMGKSASDASREFGWDTYGNTVIAVYERILHDEKADEGSRDEIAEFYNDYWDRDKGWTPTHSFSDEQLHIHFEGAFKSSDRVLDVGCGDASNYQSWLVKQVQALSALDISESGIAAARRMGLDAQVHDLSTRFPYADNSFDGATCIEVLEHLYDPKFTVQEIYRVLKPGGILVTSVPNNGYFRERLKAMTRAELSTSITDFSNEWKGAHIRFYSLDSFGRMLGVAGFEIESVRSNRDSSIFDGLDAFGGYLTQHATTALRRTLPRPLRLAFLEDLWPSLFAPHIIVWARKPLESDQHRST